MKFHILGNVDKDRLYCTGSFTKFLTTFVTLSFLSEQYNLDAILDDESFLDKISVTPAAKDFLTLFQKILGGKFSIRDLCTYYTGLPYTFSLAKDELQSIEAGNPFKHHAIPTEEMFLNRCKENIIPVFPLHSKFNYSEISTIFLGYIIEKIYNIKIEVLYQKYVIDKFKLSASVFSRKRPAHAYMQDLSPEYDYPSIAILDHGYFCYSNGFFTTLNDMKTLLEQMMNNPIFKVMTDLRYARAASNRLLNGLTIEMRIVDEDIIYGYEGLSYSGCNIWAYSTKRQEGYLTTCNSEEDAYIIIYNQQLGYTQFDKVPEASEIFYKNYLKLPNTVQEKDLPLEYQGKYHRVKINESELKIEFEIGKNYITIRNPDLITYPVIFYKNYYHIQGKDLHQSTTVGLYKADSGNRYMIFDGTLYKLIL